MDKNMSPGDAKVTVFMPVFNAERFVKEAVQSILSQTFSDFELLVIDDGSIDGTGEIIASFNDTRIHLVRHIKNIGMLETFNEGMLLAKGEYVARIDADDIAHPERLEKQTRFMDDHPDFVLLGTSAALIDEKGKRTGVEWKENIAAEKIPAVMLFHNCFVHPSVIIRRKALPVPAFQNGLTPAEDYDLWIRLTKVGKVGNLQEILTYYRVHGKNISVEKTTEKYAAVEKILRGQLARLGLSPTPEEFNLHRTNYVYTGDDVTDFLEKRQKWLGKLIEKNNETGVYSKKLFEEVVGEMFFNSCKANTRIGLQAWKIFWQSSLSQNIRWPGNISALTKFVIRCILKK